MIYGDVREQTAQPCENVQTIDAMACMTPARITNMGFAITMCGGTA